MGIQGLAISSMDKAPPKTKTLNNQEPKTSTALERKAGNQQSEIPVSKAFADAISDSVGVNMSKARLSFAKDEETGDIVIKIIDNETEEVIKQIPPEEFEQLRKRLGDILGLVLDKKV